MKTKANRKNILGCFLIALGTLLAMCLARGVKWDQAEFSFAALYLIFALWAFVSIPGLMIIRGKWSELASLVSGIICIGLFLVMLKFSNRMAPAVMDSKAFGLAAPLVGLLSVLAPFILPAVLHKYLKPLIEKYTTACLESPKASDQPE